MKTIEYQEIDRVRAAARHRTENLYPSLAEAKRLKKAYEDLGLDVRVLRALPKDSPRKS